LELGVIARGIRRKEKKKVGSAPFETERERVREYSAERAKLAKRRKE
jgi:hypothetical protein